MANSDSPTVRLKALRIRSGLSMAKVARACGYRNASSYQRYEDPELYTKEHLPPPLVRSLLDVLVGRGIPPITREEVVMLAGLDDLSPPQLRSLDEQNWIWCIGDAAAGQWREAFEWPRDEWLPLSFSIRDDRYPATQRRALRIRGDSMDALYPDGSFVIFVRLADIGRKVVTGDRVVALRHRQGLIEATVKEYLKDQKGRRWLLPRSSNPSHQAIALGPSGEDGESADEVEIFGLVVGSQTIE